MVEKRFNPYSLFRHMIYKKNNRQVSPDTSQSVYDDLIKRKHVTGCYKPYMLYKKEDGSVSTMKCSYM